MKLETTASDWTVEYMVVFSCPPYVMVMLVESVVATDDIQPVVP